MNALKSPDPAGVQEVLRFSSAGTAGDKFPALTGGSGPVMMLPLFCSPVGTTAVADIPPVCRPVFLPGLWMQISL